MKGKHSWHLGSIFIINWNFIKLWLVSIIIIEFPFFVISTGKGHVFMRQNAAGFLFTRNLYLPLDPD